MFRMDYATIVGYAAGTLATIAFVPQVIRSWKTKSTEDISLVMFSIFSAGVFLWLVFGILIGSLPVIIANVVTFILALSILFLKLRYG
jgi:MtN3 and saliva related transmembrane protein